MYSVDVDVSVDLALRRWLGEAAMEQVLQNEASCIVKTVGFNRVQSDLQVSIAILYTTR